MIHLTRGLRGGTVERSAGEGGGQKKTNFREQGETLDTEGGRGRPGSNLQKTQKPKETKKEAESLPNRSQGSIKMVGGSQAARSQKKPKKTRPPQKTQLTI